MLQGPNISAGEEDSGYSTFNTGDAVNPQRIEPALEDPKAPPHHSTALTHSWKSQCREAGLPQACLEVEQEEEGWIYSSELSGCSSTFACYTAADCADTKK